MAVRLPRTPVNLWKTATLSNPTPALPVSIFLHSKIEETTSNVIYLGGLYTNSFGNSTGLFPFGETATPQKFQCVAGHNINNTTLNSPTDSDLSWHTHIATLESNVDAKYRMDDTTEDINIIASGNWSLGLDATIGNGGGWLNGFAFSDSTHRCLGVWNIALSLSEREQLAATKNPMFVRPDALTHLWEVDGQVPLTKFGGDNMAQTGSADTLEDNPPMKRKF